MPDRRLPLTLTDRQARLVQRAATSLPALHRDEFLQRVARHLTSEPSDAAVLAAVNHQLDLMRAAPA